MAEDRDRPIERDLERLRYAVLTRLSREFLLDDASAEYDATLEAVGVAIRGHLWAESDDVERCTVRVPQPATCWQHLKQRFFLRDGWVRRRWPVRTTETVVRLRVKAVYPEFRPLLSEKLSFAGLLEIDGEG